jgi:sugar-specific transcriptional regulator TrmB
MSDPNKAKLQELGLSPAEAQIYLAIIHRGPLPAPAIANETGIKRTSVYPVICSLADKGLIEGGTGHGSKYAAVPPNEALPLLVAREKELISERERIATELGDTLASVAGDAESALDDSVQVIRTPQVIGERIHRLQLEASRLIEGFIKAPILMPRASNPAQKSAIRRGVQYRGLYERAAIADAKVGPYIRGWLALGEEARVYEGELPFKLSLFDREVVLTTLVRRTGQPAALLIRHAPFAQGMSILFDYFWNQAEPLKLHVPRRAAIAQPTRGNGARLKLRPIRA